VDLETGASAPNVDCECTGTSLRDFRRGTDAAQLPEELIARYDDDSARAGELVFQPA